MIRLLAVLALALLCTFSSYAQHIHYNDVGIIVNDNSAASVSVANYFANARQIPAKNIIHISCTDSTEISPATFQLIRAQIELKLDSAGIKDSLNYLVLTKGIPTSIIGGNCIDNLGICSSVDNELTLLFSSQSSKIGSTEYVMNPYYGSDKRYSRDTFGLYLVTRLDGYSVNDVKNMIDRSGYGKLFNKQSDEFIFILNPSPGMGAEENRIITKNCYDTLLAQGFSASRNTDTIDINHKQRVCTYTYGWNSGQLNTPINMGWAEGSIAYLPVSYLDYRNPPVFHKNLFTLISNGLTGGYQAASLITSAMIPNQTRWFTSYLRTDSQKVFFADAFYTALSNLSESHVLIGDPKATMSHSITAGFQNHETKDLFRLYPNPSDGKVFIELSSRGNEPATIEVVDQTGRIVYSTATESTMERFTLDLDALANGFYLIQLQAAGRTTTKKLILHR